MRMLIGAIILSTAFVVGAQEAPPNETLDTVPLSELLDDSYEIKTTVVNMLILQKKKSVYACNLVARTLADVKNWVGADCVDISPQ